MLVSELKTSEYYESLGHFQKDFPNAEDLRVCQKGGYNCAVECLVYNDQKTCALFLPTGTGKTRLIRALSWSLAKIHQKFCGTWLFSPNKNLKNQAAKHKANADVKALGIEEQLEFTPFVVVGSLDTDRFRNESVLESYTIQLAAYKKEGSVDVKRTIDIFIEHAKRMHNKTGKWPLVIIDACDLCSKDNYWGELLGKFQNWEFLCFF